MNADETGLIRVYLWYIPPRNFREYALPSKMWTITSENRLQNKTISAIICVASGA